MRGSNAMPSQSFFATKKYVFDLETLLSCRGATIVCVGWDLLSNQQVVAKITTLQDLTESEKQRWRTETKILQIAASHENSVPLLASFEREGRSYLIMEYTEWDLVKFLNSNPPLKRSKCRNIFTQLVYVLQFLHERLIVHGDIKLENVLYDPKAGKIRLIDYGSSFLLENPSQKLKGLLSTKCYIAPEIFFFAKYDGFKTDIYSLGVLLFALIFGEMPFTDGNEVEYYSKLTNRGKKYLYSSEPRPDFRFPKRGASGQPVSKMLISLLKGMLSINPDNRLTLAKTASHPWVQKG